MTMRLSLFLLLGLVNRGVSFVPPTTILKGSRVENLPLHLVDVATSLSDPAIIHSAGTILDSATSTVQGWTSSSSLLSFTDQGQNLAGIFFQASLLPYLLFVYFLQFRGNRLTDLSNFGFQYVLLFVLSTIPSGIISKSVYGDSLANVDWLHGGAELLLTSANVFIVRIAPKLVVSVRVSLSNKLLGSGLNASNEYGTTSST